MFCRCFCLLFTKDGALVQVGLSNRAMELFDWLRGLEPSHDLAALCDVYTYALLAKPLMAHLM